MFNPVFEKVVALILILLIPCSFLFAQVEPEALIPQQPDLQTGYSMEQGRLDGEKDAKGNPVYACGGATCGVFAVVFAAIQKPAPPTNLMYELRQSKGEAYALGYETAYITKARNKNIIYSLLGLGAATIAAVALTYTPRIQDE